MHAAISHLSGDPGELLSRYDAMREEIPAEAFALHLCLRAADGIIVVDTCPTRADYEAFYTGQAFAGMCAKHGLPLPDRHDDYPVHLGIAQGAVVAGR